MFQATDGDPIKRGTVMGYAVPLQNPSNQSSSQDSILGLPVAPTRRCRDTVLRIIRASANRDGQKAIRVFPLALPKIAYEETIAKKLAWNLSHLYTLSCARRRTGNEVAEARSLNLDMAEVIDVSSSIVDKDVDNPTQGVALSCQARVKVERQTFLALGQQSSPKRQHPPFQRGAAGEVEQACFRQVKDISFLSARIASQGAAVPVPGFGKQPQARPKPSPDAQHAQAVVFPRGDAQGSDQSDNDTVVYADDVACGYPTVFNNHQQQHYRAQLAAVQYNQQQGQHQFSTSACHLPVASSADAFAGAIPDMRTLEFLLNDAPDDDSGLSLHCLASPRFDDNMCDGDRYERGERRSCQYQHGHNQNQNQQQQGQGCGRGRGSGSGKGVCSCAVEVKEEQEQDKAMEWLFTGRACTCNKKPGKVRGKSIKDLPCSKCLMKIFMTVLDAKEASKKCGMSPTTFKKRLRNIGIKTYPSRKIRCLFRCIQSKKQALAVCQDEAQRRRVHDDLAKCREELRNFKEEFERVLAGVKVEEGSGALNFSGRFTRIRNRIHKTNYKRKKGLPVHD